MEKKKPLGIYLHIPFCVRKCNYCDFLSASEASYARGAGEVKERYVKALCREIRAQAPLYQEYEVKTVFFGGGTPSLLPGGLAASILEQLAACFSFAEEGMEISMEANPGTVDAGKLAAYRNAGVNRLSLGLQSVHEKELRLLGRIHTWEDFLESFRAAREVGFANINVDLMSALPGQSEESWMESLERVTALGPEHISAYSLMIEEGTPFWEWYHEGRKSPLGELPALPSEEEDRIMYKRSGEYLRKMGYDRYEISNYARPGYACRHNLSYWERADYAGFGLGAASLRENVRWSNTRDLGTYLTHSASPGLLTPLKEDVQRLTQQEQIEEFMFLGLRKTEGISERRFWECFHKTLQEVYAQVLQKLEREGLMCQEEGTDGALRYRLTPFGIDVSNYALAQFLF